MSDFVVTGKDDARTTHDIPFESMVEVLVLFVEQGEIGVRFLGRPKQKLSRYSGYRNGRLEHVDVFVEIKFLEPFYGRDERPDIEIVVPNEEISEAGHILVSPLSLT